MNPSTWQSFGHHFSVDWFAEKPSIVLSGDIGRATQDDYDIVVEGTVYSWAGRDLPFEDRSGHRLAALVLKTYLEKGTEVFRDALGHFSVAIISPAKKLLYRNSLSYQQIYYNEHVVSNNLLAFFDGSNIQSRLCPNYYLKYLSGTSGLRTLDSGTPFKGIQRVPLGHVLEFHQPPPCRPLVRDLTVIYPFVENPRQKIPDVAADVRRMLTQSIEDGKRGMRADILGCELSGGLDSSLVGGILGSGGEKVKAFNFSLPQFPSHQISERFARSIAERHHFDLRVFAGNELPKVGLQDFLAFRNEPGIFYWQAALFCPELSKYLPSQSVLFTGFGSDSLFLEDSRINIWLYHTGQYRRFFHNQSRMSRQYERSFVHMLMQTMTLRLPYGLRKSLNRINDALRSRLFTSEEVDSTIYQTLPKWVRGESFGESTIKDANTSICEYASVPVRLLKNGLNPIDFSFLESPSIHSDPYYRAAGIRYYHPYCDARLIDYVLKNVSWDLIHTWDRPYKYILREAQRGLVPDAVANREFNEFSFDGFLSKVLRDNRFFLSQILHDAQTPFMDHLDGQELAQTFERLLVGHTTSDTRALEYHLAYSLWFRDFQTSLQRYRNVFEASDRMSVHSARG